MNHTINTCITGLNNIGQGYWEYAGVRAVFRYCLWMLLFIKLVLPASFTLPTGIGYWLGDYFKSELSIANPLPQTQEVIQIAIPQEYLPLE
ncbi:MAG: hypothetical protein ACYSWP_18630, partial [Planctomycetota bacterium]